MGRTHRGLPLHFSFLLTNSSPSEQAKKNPLGHSENSGMPYHNLGQSGPHEGEEVGCSLGDDMRQ